MADNLDPERRSENMRRIRSSNTAPELVVRTLVRNLGGSGYRLHRKDLPGKPDLAWIGAKRAIFVHGCFWHGHDCKEGLRVPKSNAEYWTQKIARNRMRDKEHVHKLTARGWHVMTIWECELRDLRRLEKRVLRFLAK